MRNTTTDYQNYFSPPPTPGRGHVLSVQHSEQAADTFLEIFYACYSHREIAMKDIKTQKPVENKGTFECHY